MIGSAIYSILSGTIGVTSLINSRIYPDIAPQNAAYPFAIYMVDGTAPTLVKDGASPLDVVELTVTSFATTYDQAQAIAAAIRSALDVKPAGIYSGVSLQSIRFAGQQSLQMDIDKRVYMVEQMYNIRVNG